LGIDSCLSLLKFYQIIWTFKKFRLSK